MTPPPPLHCRVPAARCLALSLALVGLLSAGPVDAAEVPPALRAWLHATDESPTSDQLRRTSPHVVRDLVAVAEDPREHRFARNRAVALLSRLGQDDADAALLRVALRGDGSLRVTAWLALGAGPGVRRPAWALRQFAAVGRQRDAAVRASAARGLALVVTPAAARQTAQRLRARERAPEVQALLDTVIFRGRSKAGAAASVPAGSEAAGSTAGKH